MNDECVDRSLHDLTELFGLNHIRSTINRYLFRNSRPGENESKYCPQYLQSLCSGVGIHSEAASIVLRRYRARYPAQRL